MNNLASYRLQSAEERLIVAKENIDKGHYKDAINRSYYAIFTAIRAVLAERNSEIRRYLEKEYGA